MKITVFKIRKKTFLFTSKSSNHKEINFLDKVCDLCCSPRTDRQKYILTESENSGYAFRASGVPSLTYHQGKTDIGPRVV